MRIFENMNSCLTPPRVNSDLQSGAAWFCRHIVVSLLKASVAISLALLFVACGDDSSSKSDDSILRVVSSIYDLGSCTADREGDTVFVSDKKIDYLCAGTNWIDITTQPSASDTQDTRTNPDTPSTPPSQVPTIYDLGACTEKREGERVLVLETGLGYVCQSTQWQQMIVFPSSSSVIPGSGSESSSSFVDDPLCGDCNSSSSVRVTYIEVATKDKLVSCDSADIGLRALVLADSSYYTCKDTGWAKESSYPGYETVATRVDLPKCNVGNYKQRVLVKKESLFFACDSVKWEPEKADGYVVDNISVMGSAHKGPFKFNSPLELREVLLRNDSLIYSGRKYIDEISSNAGDFVIPKVRMIYPYAVLEVRGLWRNEVTGEWSKDSVTLRALTELTEKVNVNILTHLEYDRAINLIKKGYSVSAAKTQADYEIMTAFEITPTMSNSEAKETFGSSADPTLLAMAVLFTGNRSDTEIQTAISSFRADIAEDGIWNDEATKAEMADWAESFDYSVVRANVKSWNITVIPEFEGQLTTFWNNAYGLGGCGQSRYGIVTAVTNAKSKNYNVHYKCDAVGWRKATDFEKDTYGWDDGEEGEVKKGDVTSTYYVFENGAWTVATNENALGLCTASRNGEIGKIENTYYICDNKAWRVATMLEYDTDGFGVGDDGEVRVGKVNNDKYYVYENGAWRASANEIENNLGACVTSRLNEVSKSGNTYYTCKLSGWVTSTAIEYDTYQWTAGTEGEMRPGSVISSNHYTYAGGAWRATANDMEYEFGACVASRSNEKHTQSGKYYICENNTWKQISAEEYGLGYCTASNNGVVGKLNDVYYICKSNAWTTASVFEYDTYQWTAGTEGEMRPGSVISSNHYTYAGGTWRATLNDMEYEFGACVASRSNEKHIQSGKYYICENKTWKQITAEEYGLGYCTASNNGAVELLNGVYYICKLNAWTTASVFEYDTYQWTAGTEGEVRVGNVNKDKYYVYENGAWRASANEIENDLGACVTSRINEVGKSDDTYYTCKSSGWTLSSVLEYDTYGKTCSEDGTVVSGKVISTNRYVCDAGVFRTANEIEISLNKGCVSYTENEEIRKQISEGQDSVYTCKNNVWEASFERYIVYGTLFDERDSKSYKTVVIGSQTWMAENLNYADTVNYPGMKGRNWCYKDSLDSCAKYGRLYTWAAAMDSAGTFSTNGKNCGYGDSCSPTYPVRGICPEGWHLPKITEFNRLFTAVGGISTAGNMLKSRTGWYNNGDGTDDFGFSALPVGRRDKYGDIYGNFYYEHGDYALFWIASEYSISSGWIAYLSSDSESAGFTFGTKNYGYSVRCVKN